MSLEDFLQRRQAGLTAAFESGDIPKILAYYDPDLSFSDHAWKAVDKTYTEFVEFLRSTYQTSDSLQMETHGITGTKEFCAWEWTLRIVADADDPIRGLWKGKEVVLRGSSLHWWRLQPGKDGGEVSDWRIVQEADYACH